MKPRYVLALAIGIGLMPFLWFKGCYGDSARSAITAQVQR